MADVRICKQAHWIMKAYYVYPKEADRCMIERFIGYETHTDEECVVVNVDR